MANVKKVINVAIYTRVSTAEQAEKYSINAQLTELEKYCNMKGYKIVECYTDAGVTGTSIEKRTQFKSLLNDIQTKGNIDAILIWKLSRISRRMIDLVNILDFLESHEVCLISTSDNIDTSTQMGKTFIYLAGIFAEMERDNIVSASKNGMKQRAREGKWNGGVPPLGYSYSPEDGLIIIEEEAQTVKKIFELYTNKNYGYSKICKYLNVRLDKYSTKKNNAWSYSTVKQILDNPIYIGKIRWGIQKDWNKKRRSGTSENYILSDGIHEPIITQDLWDRTRLKRKLVGKKPNKKVHITYLLSGLPKCPECGSSMTSHRIKKKTGQSEYYRYYACSRWANTKTQCKPNLIYAQQTEEFIVNKIKEFINQPNIIQVIANNLGGDADLQSIENEIETIKSSIIKYEKDKKTYLKYLTDDTKVNKIGEDSLIEIIEEINLKLNALCSELEELKSKKLNLENNQLNYEKISFILKNFEKAFEEADENLKIELLHSIIKEIKINPADKINNRTVKEIILHFNEVDLMKCNNNTADAKSYEVIYDTAPS